MRRDIKFTMQRKDLNIFADYFQFALMDARLRPEFPQDWTDNDIKNRVKVAPNIIIVCPVRNMIVPVTIEVREGEPSDCLDAWDHVSECSIEIPSGEMLVDNLIGSLSPTYFIVKSGCYRTRIFFAGLGTLSYDGLEGNDYYKVVLWPSEPCEVSVLKQWETQA